MMAHDGERSTSFTCLALIPLNHMPSAYGTHVLYDRHHSRPRSYAASLSIQRNTATGYSNIKSPTRGF